MAPWEKTLVQPAARWLLRRRPFESSAFIMPQMSSSSALSLERCVKQTTARGWGQAQSPITLPRLKPPEKGCQRERWLCWVKRTGECSICGDGEARRHWADVSSLVTGCSNPLSCCFFLTCPWEEEMGGREGRSHSLKRKLSVSTEKQDWNSCNETNQSRWAQHQRGISPSMTHTQRECHQRTGETYTKPQYCRLLH